MNRLLGILHLARTINDDRNCSRTCFSPSVNISFHEKGAVLLHHERGVLYKVNATGARIIEAMLRGLLPEQIVPELSTHYAISSCDAARDLTVFVAELDRQSFLVTGKQVAL